MPDRKNAIDGALVADAASMGLHWMYDHQQIDLISKTGDLLFRQPERNVYEGKKAFFAHAAKRTGEFSQYGEAARVAMDVMAMESGYRTEDHRREFFETFGPCGSYHGFADRPTKALVARMIAEGDSIPARSGCDDDQMPALCVVPAAFYHEVDNEVLEAAVSVTSTNSVALQGANVLHHCLSLIVSGKPLQEAIRVSASSAGPDLRQLLLEAIDFRQYDPRAVVNHFGLPCHIPQGLPVAWHLLFHATDYESAIRENVRCGGDCCGRAMAVGSVAGLVFRVPDALKRMIRQ